jgi:Spy/CpxP family protein refolding chaperone
MKVWAVFLLAVVIFFAGAITGGLVVVSRPRQHPVSQLPPIPMRPQLRMEFLRRMDRELRLTTNQYQHIEAIIRSSHERMQKLLEPIAPQAKEEARKVKNDIAAELTPDQEKRFDELLKGHRGDSSKRRKRDATNSITQRERSGSQP